MWRVRPNKTKEVQKKKKKKKMYANGYNAFLMAQRVGKCQSSSRKIISKLMLISRLLTQKKKNLKLTVKFCSYECDFFFCFFFSIFFYCVEQQFWNHHILLGLIGFQSFGRWIDVVIHLSFRRCYFTSFDLFKL